jgi:hypothetical protein
VFADVLDAVACSVATSLIVGFGVFVIGPAASELPTRLLNLMLVANPLIATASAANVDLFRGELLYQLSPIAHREFDYPAWYVAATLYCVVAAAASLAAASAHRWRASHRFINLTQRGWS